MEEWQKHVRKEGNVAYCGANIFYEWVFVNAEHGRNTEKSGGRLQMCPKCKELLNR